MFTLERSLPPHRLTVYLSLNFLAEQALTGSALRLKLLPERLRVF